MKKFERPEMEIERIDVQDIITTSTPTEAPDCGNELEMD